MASENYGSDPRGKRNAFESGKTSSKTYTPKTGPGNQYSPGSGKYTFDVHRIKGDGGAQEPGIHNSLKK